MLKRTIAVSFFGVVAITSGCKKSKVSDAPKVAEKKVVKLSPMFEKGKDCKWDEDRGAVDKDCPAWSDFAKQIEDIDGLDDRESAKRRTVELAGSVADALNSDDLNTRHFAVSAIRQLDSAWKTNAELRRSTLEAYIKEKDVSTKELLFDEVKDSDGIDEALFPLAKEAFASTPATEKSSFASIFTNSDCKSCQAYLLELVKADGQYIGSAWPVKDARFCDEAMRYLPNGKYSESAALVLGDDKCKDHTEKALQIIAESHEDAVTLSVYSLRTNLDPGQTASAKKMLEALAKKNSALATQVQALLGSW